MRGKGGSENFQYYYHPDHLGSTAYVTDASGEVYQHLEYFAFGETFVEEHSNTNRTPYLYNGKELDEETGLYYYGARYYDPRTSIWQSVDPLAEKYPALSPYAYVANNPINLTDPDGKEIWINYGSKDDQHRVRYDNGKLYNENGSRYKGKDAFVGAVFKTLNNINGVKIGKTMLGDLSASKNAFTFSNTASTGGERTLSFEANKNGGGEIHAKALGLDTPDAQKAENASHELFHGYQQEHGETGSTINREVTAYLFGRAVGFQVGMNTGTGWAEMSWGKNNNAGKAFEQAMSKLMYGNTFDIKYYNQAINNFLSGATVNVVNANKPNGLYSGFKIKPNDTNPVIKRFYLLIQ